ncbi:PREDICTED: odorant receptor 85b-like [Polistes canadensis]|uniref:odorant receptor 85b-like n=1 Tax=Polistes canadensis TaxID=91411 RepID=UPI000718CB6A|nr:PREDICTED: odorant receptor 85b-like [Polistes canadensis]
MTVVKSTFIILGICGCWRPMSWSLSFYKRHIYNFYTIFIAFLVTTLSLTQIVGIILNANENDDISDDVYVFLAHFVSCFKMLTLVINRNNIVNLIVTLENEPHRIMDNVEANLQMKFDKLSRYAASVNKTFKFAIFMQFLASTLTVCFTLFQLTKVSTFSLEFVKITVFISGMLIQVYLYCSYGHLVTLKSQEIVYQIFDTNLVGLNNDMKKSLLIMMNRTTRPIVFIVMNLFPLNLDSFVNILKTAYTAYNFLTQTQEE